MSRNYYYFASSLPYITFDSAPPMSVDTFIEDCHRLLSKQDAEFIEKLLARKILDYAYLRRLVTETKGRITYRNEAFQKGILFNRAFRNELAWFRAERAGKDPNEYIRGDRVPDPKIQEVIRAADREDNLLEAEMILDRFRWAFLDELESGHYYDIEFITIYGIKLSILERYQIIDSPRGEEIFEELKNLKIPAIN